MKTKRMFPAAFVILLIFLTAFVLPVSAEDEPRGKYEITSSQTNTGDKIQYFHQWYDSMDQLWSELDLDGGFNRITEIKMFADWDVYEEKTLEVYNGHVVIDLNGHNIIRHTDGNKQVRNGGIFRISNNAHLEILDSRPDSAGYDGIKGGVITGGASTNGGGAFTVTDWGQLTIRGGTIYKCTTNEYGGAVMLKGNNDWPHFEMYGGRIYFCQTTGSWANCHGGAVYADHSDIRLSDCKIDSCYSEDNGGALYLNKCTVNVNNVQFIGNHCLDYGGALYISGSSMKIFRSHFSSNEANKDGGAVYVDGGEGAQFRDCILNKNKSYGAGGAIYVNGPGTFLIDTDIIANSAADYGGGVYVDSMNDIGVKGLVRIYNNSGKKMRNNLTLQDGFASRAYLSDGGLYEGSNIGLSSTGLNVKYGDDISEYQKDYFFSELGDIKMYRFNEVEAPVYSSVFSEGGAVWFSAGLGLCLLVGALTYAVLMKKKKVKEG